MYLLPGALLFLAMFPVRGPYAELLPGPCFVQGNPWRTVGHIDRRARIVSMVSEKAGHSPFNIFPQMNLYGNCIEVYFSNREERINLTVVCRSQWADVHTYSQCPRYTPGVRWLLGNLIYLQYDAHRFELSSCAEHNETHSYHGRLLLADDIEARSLANLPMWKAKLEEPGAVSFLYNSSCANCLFRNEYVALVPQQNEVPMGPVEPLPYCVNGQHETSTAGTEQTTTPAAFGTLPMVLLICTAVLTVGGLLLCIKKADANAVTPVISLSDR